MGLKIRKVTKDDMDAFIKVYKSAYEGFEEYAYRKEKNIKQYFKWLMKRDEEGFFVAEIDGKIAGFVAADSTWYSFFDAEVGEIHEIVVLKEYKGKGIGKKLMEAAENYLKSKGYSIIELWVGEKNHVAKKFYEKLGYVAEEQYGIWIRMVKKL